MPHLLIFGKDIVALSGTITDKWVLKLFPWLELEDKQ